MSWENYNFVKHQTSSFRTRIFAIAEDFEKDTLLRLITAMDFQDVYSMFGLDLDFIEGGEGLHRLILKSLREKGMLGVVYSLDNLPIIAEVEEGYSGTLIGESDLLELIRLRKLSTEYYASNETVLDFPSILRPAFRAEMVSNYIRLTEVYTDFLKTFMTPEMVEAMDTKLKRIRSRIDSLKKDAEAKKEL